MVTRLTYRDEGDGQHEVVVRRMAAGDWEVLDVATDGIRVIERLDGSVDGEPQAEAIARDYIGRFAAGAGHGPEEAIPEHGGRDADSHRRPPTGPRDHRARRVALPHPAR